MTIFYLRLTVCFLIASLNKPWLIQDTKNGLKRYRTRIHIAIGLVVTTFIIVIMIIYLSCRPFHHYWQINPNPGNACQAAIERVYRHIPYLDTCSDALEVDLEIFEEGRRNASAQRWYVHCCLRNSEEYLCYCCKY
jgi:hypothetical protein